jgi:hypothetical protein
VVIVKGFGSSTKLPGKYGSSIEVEPREFLDASTGKREYGVTVQVRETARLERENTSYVDFDEIESLLKGLDYIAKIDGSVTKLERFEASYRTRGDLEITAFAESGGARGAISSGKIGRVDAFVDSQTLAKFRDALAAAKQRLESIRQ